ncbi:MAG TPA: hypothetical protein VFH43_10325 [Candidatus Kapabacteria bacterium]|nr:hypothetical protein [Candidatus Kapabacteria bacterium]
MKSLVTALFLAVLLFTTTVTALPADSTKDDAGSGIYSESSDGDTTSVNYFGVKWKKRTRSFLITEMESPRQYHYREPFSMIDFNRVDGFFLGLGSSNMADFGEHDELGVNGGFGYGFEDKRWQYFMGAEYRLPLEPLPTSADTVGSRLFYVPMTLAVGGEFHNQTGTEDHWRARRLENSQYAFWAREDFRDYYKIAGWSAHLAFRPMRNRELRVEWRSDRYEQRDQQVFYGRFGGNKVLPPNPHSTSFVNFGSITPGDLRALVITYQAEGATERSTEAPNFLGDTVEFTELAGFSTLVQAELGHMPGADFGFNRYLMDVRGFNPVIPGLALDTRLRFEATTGDAPYQKLQALGGPGSLPAMGYKELMGNRLLLLNTELRLSFAALSSFFERSDMQLVLMNDFGFVTYEPKATSIFEGFSRLEPATIAYNVGVALGHVSGIQIGSYWRTDRDADARFFFRLERPF